MSGLIDALNKGLRLLKHGDDDFFDRLSSRYSVALCIVFAVVVSTGKVPAQGCHRTVTGLSQGCHRAVTHTHCDIACHTVTLWYKLKANYIHMFIYSCRWQKNSCQVRGLFGEDLGFKEELQLLEWNLSIKLTYSTECCKWGGRYLSDYVKVSVFGTVPGISSTPLIHRHMRAVLFLAWSLTSLTAR